VTASGLFANVYRDLLSGRTPLPSLPDVAVRLRRALSDPDCDLKRVTRVVQGAPPVAAYLIKVVNSPLYRGFHNVSDVKAAVTRLGLRGTRNLVTTYTLRHLFESGSPLLRELMAGVWREGTRLAALSAVLATRIRGVDPDRALLGGLLQDIGALPLLTQVEHRPELANDRGAVLAVLEEYTALAGGALLKHWGFDAELVEVARSREDWQRDPGPAADLADLVLLARLHAYVGTPRMRYCPRIDAVPAFRKLPGLRLTPQSSLAVLGAARKEVDEVQRLLGG
jgi:HD-like signal output (HDOD) protein